MSDISAEELRKLAAEAEVHLPKALELAQALDDLFRAGLLFHADEVREVVGPLADYANCYDPPENDDDERCWDATATPTLGELRAARALLSKLPPNGAKGE